MTFPIQPVANLPIIRVHRWASEYLDDSVAVYSCTKRISTKKNHSYFKDMEATASEESRRVLVAVDGSAASELAVEFYLKEVQRPNDTVLLVHMFDAPSPPAISLRHPSPEPWDEWRERVDVKLKEVREMMKAHERSCDKHSLKQKVIIHTGNPGEGICKIVDEYKPIMVVMGSRGLNLIRRTFMGSVSSYVLHHVDIPVVIIPHQGQ